MSALRKLPLLLALAAAALLLNLLPLPGAMDLARPYWLLLVLGAWALQQGNTYLLATAFVTGLLLDEAVTIATLASLMAALTLFGALLAAAAPRRDRDGKREGRKRANA